MSRFVRQAIANCLHARAWMDTDVVGCLVGTGLQ